MLNFEFDVNNKLKFSASHLLTFRYFKLEKVKRGNKISLKFLKLSVINWEAKIVQNRTDYLILLRQADSIKSRFSNYMNCMWQTFSSKTIIAHDLNVHLVGIAGTDKEWKKKKQDSLTEKNGRVRKFLIPPPCASSQKS